MNLSPVLLDHFSRNYMEFIALVQAGAISRATASNWCRQIWQHIYEQFYREAKAA